jgi:hypothetical protein
VQLFALSLLSLFGSLPLTSLYFKYGGTVKIIDAIDIWRPFEVQDFLPRHAAVGQVY